jgi:predicted dehydrogenase
MSKKVRWGILGVAKINERLLPAFAHTPNAELVGIASRSLERAQAAAAEAGIPQAYGSYEELLDDPEIDVVYNPLPNTLHAEWTRKAADRGKHVLCEKPLAPTARECEDLVEYCRHKRIKLMDGFMWPHHPRTAKIKELLQGDRIGPVQHVSATFTFHLPMDPSNIRLQPQMAGGGLLDVGCYPVYGIRWAFDEEPVRAWATARFHFGVDVALTGVLWFADGRSANFDCGFTRPFRQWFEIVGDKGTITVPDMWLPREAAFTLQFDEDLSATKVVVPGHDQIQLMLEHFGQYVLKDESVLPSPEEAVKTAKVMDALLESARTGRVVEV